MVHMLLEELFKENGLTCFHFLREDAECIQILGYGPPAELLKMQAQEFADPQALECCDWTSGFQSKEMPFFKEGRRLGFHVNIYPARRLHSSQREDDVFLLQDNPSLTREEVYEDWFRHKLEGAATVESFTMVNFGYEARTLRSHGPSRRRFRILKMPVSDWDGTIVVSDENKFSEILKRGIGRHRHLGFGMLRLYPPTHGESPQGLR